VREEAAEDFDRFVVEYAERLGRFAHQLTGSHDAALDLLQDLFIVVLGKWDKVEAADHRFAYVRRMLVNLHLNNRQRRVDPSVPVAFIEVAQEAEDQRVADLDALWNALNELSPRQRAVLALRYYEGLPDEEVAAILGCQRATVRSLAARGLSQMRKSAQLIGTEEGSLS
jgi:RNA polymerase sigma-70 factor (sigma-E family)